MVFTLIYNLKKLSGHIILVIGLQNNKKLGYKKKCPIGFISS